MNASRVFPPARASIPDRGDRVVPLRLSPLPEACLFVAVEACNHREYVAPVRANALGRSFLKPRDSTGGFRVR